MTQKRGKVELNMDGVLYEVVHNDGAAAAIFCRPKPNRYGLRPCRKVWDETQSTEARPIVRRVLDRFVKEMDARG